MSNITLNYWSGRGLMEVTRVMLALSGKFPPADYEDGRYPFGPIPKHVNLAANNGRLPVANIGGVEIGQSIGIWYYFAAELGFLGKNNLEAAQILAVVETIKEVITEFGKLFPFHQPAPQENVDKWFDQGATDIDGQADMSKRGERFLPWWTGRLENQLTGEPGFAVGNKLSLADLVIYNAYAETLEAHQTDDKTSKLFVEPFTSKERTNKLLAKHPKIKAICDNVAAQPNFQRWLKERGVQSF